jgi:RND superfamily putative drug exporter
VVTGRRGKWLVLAIWLIAAFALFPVGSKLSDVTSDDTESFLPASAESTEVVRLLDHDFPQGETDTAIVVYKRADQQKIASDAQRIQAAGKSKIDLVEAAQVPFAPKSPPNLVSENGDVATAIYTTPTDFEKEADWGQAIRDITDTGTGGMQVFVTGGVGFATDAHDVFSNIDTKLLLATVLLVLVLLGAIYRSVLVALSPLIVVFFAYTVTQALVYALAKSGATVSSNSTSILIVLMFGVGTDYCLLLVSRYREELRRIEDKHEAMGRALRRAGPAIFASGMTVSLAMLTLTLADNKNTSSLGPVAAIAVFTAMVAGLTLLPTLLTIFGRRGFWPRRSVVAYDPEHPSVGWPTRSTTRPPASSSTRWRRSRASTCCGAPSPLGHWRRRRSWCRAKPAPSRPATSGRSTPGCGTSTAWPPSATPACAPPTARSQRWTRS